MTVKLTFKSSFKSGWPDQEAKSLNAGILEMATDIHRRAIILAPKLSRALVNSGVIEPVFRGYRIKFGNSRVPYARRRHFENKKNPQTIGYLSKAADSVTRGDIGKYFRGKI